MAFVWNRFSYDVEPVSREPERADFVKEQKSALLCPFMIGIMAAIVFQGMLRDGATTWMPSYVAETYHIGNEISILTGVTIPIFGILCLKITAFSLASERCQHCDCACSPVIAPRFPLLCRQFLLAVCTV